MTLHLGQEIDLQEGFENVPQTLIRLFTGQNLGKQLLKIADPPLPRRSSAVEKAAIGLYTAYLSRRIRNSV